jgi:hypothetical protein
MLLTSYQALVYSTKQLLLRHKYNQTRLRMCIISEEGLHILFLAEHPNLHIHSKVKFQTGLGALKRDLNNISKECEMHSFYYTKAPLRVALLVLL